MTNMKLDTVISAFMLSFGISYVLYYIASFIVAVGLALFASGDHIVGTTIDHNNAFNLLFYSLVSAVQLILSFLFFRIRRFRNGFPFLLKRFAVVAALIISGVVMVLITWANSAGMAEDASAVPLFFSGLLIIGIGIYIWIKRGIRMFYRKNQEKRSIEILERELAEQKEENRRLAEQNNTLRVTDHKNRQRLAALERATFLMSGGMEASEELAVTIEDIKRLARDYQSDVGQLEGKSDLPSTKIKMLDSIFEDFAARLMSDNIDFKLKVNGSIPYMVGNVIEQGKLETMIGDHLQNALIAVNASDNTLRCIWAVIGLTGDSYKFAVYDSGIPFEVDTLVRLGSERVTTHADNGGSGIGFMTTFQTMRESNASLVISEKPPSGSDYTKSVTVRFNGKGQYIIETYRPGEFPNSERFVLVG
jgi:signal transduction histidine kinase